MKNIKTVFSIGLAICIALTAQSFGFQGAASSTVIKRPMLAKNIILGMAQTHPQSSASQSSQSRPLAALEPLTINGLQGHPLGSPLWAIVITPGVSSIPTGLYRQFNATGIYRDGSTQDLTERVIWTSSSPSVATVDRWKGRAHVRSAGSAVIRAILGNTSGLATLHGVDITTTHVYVDNAEVSGLNGVADFAAQSSGALMNGNKQIEMGATIPTTPALAPSQRWLYLPDTNNQIAGFAVNQATWALTPMAGAQPTGDTPVAIAVNGPQSTVYTVNISSNNISGFRFNPTTGALTPVPGSPFAAGDMPDAIAVDPSGQHVYVANMNANTVSTYSMNPNVPGALVHVADQELPGTMPVAVAIDVTGSFLYVVEDGTNDLAAFKIDAKSGSLSPVPGSPFAAGSYPFSIAIDPSGSYVYVEANGSVLAFAINAANGALSSIGGFQVNEMIDTLIVDPSGRYLYTADWGPTAAPGNITTLAINPISGVLTLVQQMPFAGYPGNMTAGAIMH